MITMAPIMELFGFAISGRVIISYFDFTLFRKFLHIFYNKLFDWIKNRRYSYSSTKTSRLPVEEERPKKRRKLEMSNETTKNGLNKTELTRLIIQSLYSLNYKDAARQLEKESLIELHTNEISTLRNNILEGKWDKVFYFFLKFPQGHLQFISP
jgi:hypothetical protein